MLNVSGHRLGTAEIESALVAHDAVAEAAVVGFPHEIKGTGIYAYVVLTADYAGRGPRETGGRAQGAGAARHRRLRGAGRRSTSPRGLPKTRSGKIMRRILRKIAASEYEGLGDTSTLADPEVVDRLIEEHRSRG